MKYILKLSLSVWATLALLVGGAVACLSPAWSADQKPLVINPTTGKQEQLQADNTLSLPANLFSMLRTTTDPSGTSNPFLIAQTVALTGNNANRPYAAITWTTTDTAFNYTGFYNRALQVTASHVGTGTVSTLTSLNADSVMNRAGGTTTRMTSMRAAGPTVLAGTVTTGNALYLDNAAATGTLTTYNALEIAPITVGTTHRAIYTQGEGLVVLSDTTQSTSKDTGAVISEGGIAAEKNITAGGNILLDSASSSFIQNPNVTSPGSVNGIQLFQGGTVYIGAKAATNVVLWVGASDAFTVSDSLAQIKQPTNLTGNLTLTTAGNGIRIKEGTNAKMGAAVLVGGTVTVNTTAVTATSRIYLTSQADGGTPGFQRVSARSAGTSFTITSSNVLDTSTVAWMIVEPAP